jgi:hypothetical protein
MEGIAIASSAIALLDVVVKISRMVAILDESIHTVEVHELANELKSFAAVLYIVKDLLSANHHISYHDAITLELNGASLTADEMDKALQKVLPYNLQGGITKKISFKKAMVRMKYLAMADKLAKLQGNLRHHTSSLGVLLNAAQMYVYTTLGIPIH